MKLMLSMIVRNESERIERCLKSVAPYIDSWCILDTGSTDDTKDKISTFFRHAGISGSLHDGEFIDFSQARNKALEYARMTNTVRQADFFLLCDADMELIVKDVPAFLDDRNGLAYEMTQQAGTLHYTNARLLNAYVPGEYVGPTHEYLNVTSSGAIPPDIAYFVDHADGSNRPEKFRRDIRLLLKALEKEPNNARYMYYLASSYADAGDHAMAAEWFRKRIKAGGWDQEVWHAELRLAHSYKEAKMENHFVGTLMSAYSRRPSRAESMYDLARWYREQKDQQAAALACAEAVEHLTGTTDNLFVSDFVYKVGIREEISIAAAYVPGKAKKGFRTCDELALDKTPYVYVRVGARANIYWYLKPLAEHCPSFKWRTIPFIPPGYYTPMNPSVAVLNKRVYLNVRAVNYRIDESGRYIIRATDGTANAENPIDTRNFIMDLGSDLLDGPEPVITECYRPGNMPCEFNLVTGFEDLRLFTWKGELWGVSTVRQLAADGQCEQVLTRLEPRFHGTGTDLRPDCYHHTDMKRMLREPRVTEKNWAPISWDNADDKLFMWRPGTVVNEDGHTVLDNPPSFEVDNISGSSALVYADGFWWALVHTAHSLPNEPYKRYYYHRFIEYDRDFKVRRMTLPFVFNDRVIEFANGLCRRPDSSDLIISYGFKDSEARLGTVSFEDVYEMLAKGYRYDQFGRRRT